VPAYQAFIDQPGDATGHARPRDERPVRELRHAQLTVGCRQLSEHVEVGQGQARLSFQVRVEAAHERGVGPQQRAPGPEPTAARHLSLYEPVEEPCDTGPEDARAQAAYGIHSAVNKILIINREIVPERITVDLIDEVLGF